MMRWSERLLDQGEQRGVQKGLQQGLQQGLRQGLSCWPSASVPWMRPFRRVWSKLMRRR